MLIQIADSTHSRGGIVCKIHTTTTLVLVNSASHAHLFVWEDEILVSNGMQACPAAVGSAVGRPVACDSHAGYSTTCVSQQHPLW